MEQVYKQFGSEHQEGIASMNLQEARQYIAEGQFGEGDMLPKIEAAVSYLSSNREGSVLITSLDAVSDALKGKAGTLITA